MKCLGFGLLIVFWMECSPTDTTPEDASFCRNAKAIEWIASNPRWQKEQIDAHNAKVKACRKSSKPQ